MKTNHIHICMGLSSLFVFATHAMNESIVIACNFDATSSNQDTSHLITNALYGAKHILKCFSWKSLLNLGATVALLKTRGDEIAKTTPGITNTIRKLFAEFEREKYGTFRQDTLACFNDMGINPIPDHEAVGLLETVKSYDIPVIGIGNKDSLEYEIFARKMQTNHGIDTQKLFNGIVTIPTFDEEATLLKTSQDYLQRNPHWAVCKGTCHDKAYVKTVCTIASALRSQAHIIPVDTKDQLSFLVHALNQVHELRPPSPEPATLLDKLIKEKIHTEPLRINA